MEGESGKSIFTPRAGSRSLSIFNRRGNNFVRNGRFNIGEIADQVRKHGSVSFEHGDLSDEVKPPRPFQRRFGRDSDDSYDIRDPNPPQNAGTDKASLDFHRCVRTVTAYPVSVDTMTPVTEDGGVRKRILKEGSGEVGLVVDGCRVWIHYDTYLDHGPGRKLTLLDSTVDHELACSLKIGEDGIAGLQFGVKTMRVGEVAEFGIRPEYGYGKNGIIGWIEKNQALRMVVELKEVKQKHRKPFTLMTQLEREEATSTGISFDELLSEVDQLIKAGNAKFENRHFWDACDRYNWAMDLFRDFKVTGADQQRVVDQRKFRILSNLALGLLRREEFDLAQDCCEEALQLRHHEQDLKPKVIYRLAMAFYKQNKFQQAKEHCLQGLREGAWGHVEFRDLKYRAENAMHRWNVREQLSRQNSNSPPESPEDGTQEE